MIPSAIAGMGVLLSPSDTDLGEIQEKKAGLSHRVVGKVPESLHIEIFVVETEGTIMIGSNALFVATAWLGWMVWTGDGMVRKDILQEDT